MLFQPSARLANLVRLGGCCSLRPNRIGYTVESYDWEGAAERIIDLLGTMGRSDDWKELERKHPRRGRDVDMPPRHALPSPTKAISDRPVFPPQARKVGRNDPCPCGSGRKYKKCCLERA